MLRIRNIVFLVVAICFTGILSAQQTYTLSGTIADSTNGETIIGAIVYVKSLGKGATANTYGFYSLTLPEGTYDVSFSFISYQTTSRRITLNKSFNLSYSGHDL